MERMKKYGDPHDLLCAEDRIVLKLETPWPRDTPLPEGCSPADEGGSLMVMNQRTLASARSALRGARVSGALFAGCEAFDSSDLFERAAREVLKFAEEICIVHNRDKVYKLIRMFPRAKVLALLHDFAAHAVEMDEPFRDLSTPLVESCELRELLGSVEGFGDCCLMLTEATVRAILRTCPLLRRIDADGVLEAFLKLTDAAQYVYPKAKGITGVVMVASVDPSHAGPGHFPGTADIAVAARTFPHVENLMVVVNSPESMAAISAFRHLRSLTLTLRPAVSLVHVGSELRQLLTTLPHLENLSLESCGGVQLAGIAKLCPQIKSLRLVYCEGSNDDIALDGNAFPNLEVLELTANLPRRIYHAFLGATASRLRVLRLGADGACSEFLRLCGLGGRGVSFPHLEELTLQTDWTVSALELQPEDLHGVLKALPALRHLETDSYDLRLFFENYCVARERVSFSWCECVYCAVHDGNRKFRQDFFAHVASRLV
uniref:Putative beta-tubulin folding cofactor e n=1 Tax=Amblyomma aureolatum TaxID=187763 RepID=A0A1E1XEF6_9ACAR